MKRILTLFFLLAVAWCAIGGPLDSQLPISGPRGGGVKLPLQNPMTTDISSYDFNASNSAEKQIITTTPSSSNITYSSSASDVIQISTTGKMTPYLATGSTIITVSQPASAYFKSKEITIPVTSSVLGWQAASAAVYFDGVDDFIINELPRFFGLSNPMSGKSICFWYKLLLPLKRPSIGLMSIWQDQNYGWPGFFAVVDNSSTLSITGQYSCKLSFPYQLDSNWHHLALCFPPSSDGIVKLASCSFYLDGNLLVNGTFIPNPYHPTADTINTNWYTQDPSSNRQMYFPSQAAIGSMKIAEIVHTYKTCFSADQVRNIMQQRVPSDSSYLIQLFHCDDATGTTLLDSISGNNATLMGGATWTNRLP